MKSALGKRLLNFIVGIPLYLSAILLLPQGNHLVLKILLVTLVALGTLEARRLFSDSDYQLPTPLALTLGLTPPILGSLTNGLPWFPTIDPVVLVYGSILVAAITGVASFRSQYPGRGRSAFFQSLAVSMYPGIFAMGALQLLDLGYGHWPFTAMILIVYGNDSFAYVGGALAGKKSGHPAPMSPGKTWAGFISGTLFSLAISFVIFLSVDFGYKHPVFVAVLFAVGLSFTGIFGDLLESVFKRGRNVKDSGQIFPGRGGVLDSIDSVLISGSAYILLHRFAHSLSL